MRIRTDEERPWIACKICGTVMKEGQCECHAVNVRHTDLGTVIVGEDGAIVIDTEG